MKTMSEQKRDAGPIFFQNYFSTGKQLCFKHSHTREVFYCIYIYCYYDVAVHKDCIPVCYLQNYILWHTYSTISANSLFLLFMQSKYVGMLKTYYAHVRVPRFYFYMNLLL